jgi:hypothetical protein
MGLGIRHFYRWLAPAYQSRPVTFKEWIEAEPYGELSDHHPLRAAGGSTFVQDDPVTVGPLRGIISLFDGYHRAVRGDLVRHLAFAALLALADLSSGDSFAGRLSSRSPAKTAA